MAIALEELTPEAGAAVSAARAGQGGRLSSAVRGELRAKATKAVTRAASSAPSSDAPSGPPTHVAAGLVHGAGSINAQGAKIISGGKGGTAARIIFAFGAGLLALEVASYLSGRYFNYNIGKGVTKAQTAAQYIGLYPGQTAKLAAPAAPQSSALSHYGTAV